MITLVYEIKNFIKKNFFIFFFINPKHKRKYLSNVKLGNSLLIYCQIHIFNKFQSSSKTQLTNILRIS